MALRKDSHAQEADLYPSDTSPAVATVIARAAEAREVHHADEKMHVFWRVFGGAIASIVALVGLTLYNNTQSNIIELRSELAKAQEARTEFVKKDEFNSRISTNYERLGNLQTLNSTQNATLLSLRTDLDATKERLTKETTGIDSVRKDVAIIEALKEKIAQLQSDLKTVREENAKTKLDIEQNKLADAERKAYRDEQAKEYERTVKELHASVQDCRLKLARLEGQQSKPEAKAKDAP